MKTLNLFILIMFSLAGILAAQEDITLSYMSEWGDIFFMFPSSLITGVILLGTSIISYPVSTWNKFTLNSFALNPTQPHSFIMFIGLIFTLAGIIGFLAAYFQSTGFYKYPALVFFMGSGVFISGLLGCLYVYYRQRTK